MKKKKLIIKITAFLTIFVVGFSCSDDSCDCPQGAVEFINSGKKTSSIKIDDNIISFEIPYVICAWILEHPARPNGRTPESLSPHFWTISLFMAKGTDTKKLAPIISLAPGAKITWIGNDQGPNPVDYSGIVKMGVTDFSKQIEFGVIAPDGSTVTYSFVTADLCDFMN